MTDEPKAELERLLSHIEWLRGDHEECNPWLADTIAALLAERDALRAQLAPARAECDAYKVIIMNSVIDLQGAGYQAFEKTSNGFDDVYDEGDKILLDGTSVCLDGLYILGPVAVKEMFDEARADALREAAEKARVMWVSQPEEIEDAILALIDAPQPAADPVGHPASYDPDTPMPQPAADPVAQAARVLLDQPYRVMRPAFDAAERMQDEGADRIIQAALRAIAGGEHKP